MTHRLEKVRQWLREQELDAILVTGRPNTFWLTGFTGSTSMLLVSHAQAHLLVDFRYTIQAREQVEPAIEVLEIEDTFHKTLDGVLGKTLCGRIAYEGGILTVSEMDRLVERLTHAVHWVNAGNRVDLMRAVKDAGEIAILAEAVRLGDQVFTEILPLMRPGVREAELAAEMEYRMRKLGCSGPSFDTIIAAGHNGALCHWAASQTELKLGDAVVMDFGVKWKGYCSDMTRTVFIGQPDPEMKRIYDIVLAAQRNALDHLSVGMTGVAADALARGVIEAAGFGKCFGHSLGHGVGIEIHEEPRLSSKSEDVLCDGMVVTVEPGIYVEGLGGVRIEDMVTFAGGRMRNLTGSPKEAIIL